MNTTLTVNIGQILLLNLTNFDLTSEPHMSQIRLTAGLRIKTKKNLKMIHPTFTQHC